MASTKLSLPYYLTNTPLIRLSNSINEGVIVNKDNNLTGEKIKFDNTYLNINESTNNANSLIYINDSSQFGSLALPNRNEDKNESFILTSKKKNEAAGQGGWKWTNILDLPLTKYLTVNINISNKTEEEILINNANNELFFNNNYNYIGIFDLYIKINPITISNYIKEDIGLCLIINKDTSIYDILDITTTTNSYINKVKIINNIISPPENTTITLDCYFINNYTNIFANENINNNLEQISDISSLGLEIYGTLTIFEFKKCQTVAEQQYFLFYIKYVKTFFFQISFFFLLIYVINMSYIFIKFFF